MPPPLRPTYGLTSNTGLSRTLNSDFYRDTTHGLVMIRAFVHEELNFEAS